MRKYVLITIGAMIAYAVGFLLSGCMTINVTVTGECNEVLVTTDKNVAIPTEASVVP